VDLNCIFTLQFLLNWIWIGFGFDNFVLNFFANLNSVLESQITVFID